MNNISNFIYRLLRKVWRKGDTLLSRIITHCKFKVFDVSYVDFKTNGIPVVDIFNKGHLKIGRNFSMNNGRHYNIIGRQQPCIFVAMNGGQISIGENVGISGTAINCSLRVTINDNVRIGGNTVIYDHDFHSLNPLLRASGEERQEHISKKEVCIDKNAFIGAHCTILKGSNIGENSILGAGSLLAGKIPPNEIWAGNPARFLKKLEIFRVE